MKRQDANTAWNELTELHRHIDVSVRHSTLHSLAQERGLVPNSTSLENFLEDFILFEPLKDLGSVLSQFSLYQKVLDRPDVIERCAFEAAEDAYADGIRTIEFRFSPGFVTEFSKLAWDECLEAFDSGLKRAMSALPGFKTGLICIASRDLGTDSVAQTAEFFLKWKNRFIAFDLAGDESAYPNPLYRNAIRPVIESGSKITIHAGEASGPDSVWSAIEELGAHRIGHGIRSVEDPKLMEFLRDKGILLEMCPTSNRVTSAWTDLATHPFKTCVELGVPASLNTDDPSVFGNSLSGEIRIARENMGLSDEQILRSFELAKEKSFIRS
jgi:adenosine deaminase